MEKGNVSEGAKDSAAVENTPTGDAEQSVEKPKGLSARDALEVAIAATKEPEKQGEDNEQSSRERVTGEAGSSIDGVRAGERGADPSGSSVPDSAGNAGGLQPPAEYNAEEKADFVTLSRRGQEAQLRLHQSRQRDRQELYREREQIKIENAEREYLKDVEKELAPYFKATNGKIPTRDMILKALQMRNEFDNGDPRQAAAAYLQAKGMPVPAELLNSDSEPTKKIALEAMAPLQEKISALENRIASEDLNRRAEVLLSNWGTFEQEKNAGGSARFPDASGPQMAANIGSLCSGMTDLSKQFIANVQARIPDLTWSKLFEEAYKFHGGRVDGSTEAPRPTSQNQIAKSRRAASSVPGRGAPTANGNTKKFGSYREAAAAALAEIREREGE